MTVSTVVAGAPPVADEGAPLVVNAVGPDSDVLERLDLASLRAMDGPGLEQLAADIRRFLVDSVAGTGGHLGLQPRRRRADLGPAPRLRLARGRHRVGHRPPGLRAQAGDRAGRGLRPAAPGRGLSGYPNRLESDHDLVENSHASTALSYAYGLARARRLRGDDRPVVAVVGDGALTGGLAYEALNNIGTHGRAGRRSSSTTTGGRTPRPCPGCPAGRAADDG